jgi:hypothetical protein
VATAARNLRVSANVLAIMFGASCIDVLRVVSTSTGRATPQARLPFPAENLHTAADPPVKNIFRHAVIRPAPPARSAVILSADS